jgi:hypothetical protein
VRTLATLIDRLRNGWIGDEVFEPAGVVLKTLRRGRFLLAAEPGREGAPVLATMASGKPGRIG